MKKLLLHLLFLAMCTSISAQKSSTKPSISGPNGFKISSFSGNLFHKRPDLQIESIGPDLNLFFAYNNSKRNLDKGYGFGWTFSFNMYYEIDENQIVTIHWADGSKTKYFQSGAFDYLAEKGVYSELSNLGSGDFKLRDKEGTSYYFENQNHKKLTSIEDRCGNTLTLSYADTLLTQITDATNRSIDFEWENGHLTKMSHQLLDEPIEFLYEYDNEGNLISRTDPMTYSITYRYDDLHRMVEMIDQNNVPTNITYQPSGGVKTLASCDFSYNFTYNQARRKTYVVEEIAGDRLITTYQFDEANRIIEKLGNCCGFNMKYNYDENNNISKRIDGNGNEKLFVYDDKGNPLYITDEAGNQEVFTYEAFYNYISGETDKLGNETKYEYDAKGNLTKVSKPLDVVETYTYDNFGNIQTITDPMGYTTSFEYNEHGYLAKIKTPYNTSEEYEYDAVGNLIATTNGNGYETTMEYDALNRLMSTTNPLNYTTQYNYDAKGFLIELTNPKGGITSFEYDGLGREILTTTPMGFTASKEYDNRNNITARIDANGNKTTYTYNFRGQLLTETDALGNTMSHDYDANGNLIGKTDKNGNTTAYKINRSNQITGIVDPLGNEFNQLRDRRGATIGSIDANGHTVSAEYDALNRKIKEIDPLGHTIEFAFDKNGNLINEKDRNGYHVEYVYDSLDREIVAIAANGGEFSTTYDANSNVLSRTNAKNQTTTYTYNALDQKESETNPLGQTTTFEYDSLGNLVTEIRFSGNTINYVYDADNRLVAQSDNLGLIKEISYDNNGNILSETDGEGRTLAYEYDALNRPIKVISQEEGTSIRKYDANSNIVELIEPNGASRKYEYDANNRKTKTIDANGGITNIEYDAVGNISKLSDSNGNITQYFYNALNKPTEIILPSGERERFTYDPNQNIVSRTERDGSTISYAYNELNMLVEKTIPNEAPHIYEYDSIGNLLMTQNQFAQIDFEYDVLNRQTSETLNGKTITTIYNDNERKRSLTYPSGKVVETNLNERYRPTEVLQNGTSLATYSYDLSDNLTSHVYANDITTNYSYNQDNRLLAISTGMNNLINIQYQYDEYGQRVSKEILHAPDRSEKYSFNELNQLTEFKRGNLQAGSTPIFSQSFSYDSNGNRVTATVDDETRIYGTNTNNQYTSLTTNTNSETIDFIYSQRGNLLFDGQHNYEYDGQNKLIAVDDEAVRYEYDPLGRKTKRVEANNTRYYYYDDKKLIEEWNENDEVVQSYIYAWKANFPLAMEKEDELYFYHQNHIYSTIAMSDEAGNIVERYEYDAYGNTFFYDADYNEIPNSTIGNRFLYTSAELDDYTNLYHMRARFYNPALGRFMQPDPIGYFDGMNLYQYARSNPISWFDPDGLSCLPPELTDKRWKKIVGLYKKLDKKARITKRLFAGLYRRIPIPIRKAIKKFQKLKFDLDVDGKLCKECCESEKKEYYAGFAQITISAEVDFGIGDDRLGTVNPPEGPDSEDSFLGIPIKITFRPLKVSGDITFNISRNSCGKLSGSACDKITADQYAGFKIDTSKVPELFESSLDIGASANVNQQLSVCLNCEEGGCDVKVKYCAFADINAWGKAKLFGEEKALPIQRPETGPTERNCIGN